MRSGDFDIGAIWFLPSMTPTRDVTNMFSSATADQEHSSNYPNMRDPAVDHLINAMYAARSWEEFVAATRWTESYFGISILFPACPRWILHLAGGISLVFRRMVS